MPENTLADVTAHFADLTIYHVGHWRRLRAVDLRPRMDGRVTVELDDRRGREWVTVEASTPVMRGRPDEPTTPTAPAVSREEMRAYYGVHANRVYRLCTLTDTGDLDRVELPVDDAREAECMASTVRRLGYDCEIETGHRGRPVVVVLATEDDETEDEQ